MLGQQASHKVKMLLFIYSFQKTENVMHFAHLVKQAAVDCFMTNLSILGFKCFISPTQVGTVRACERSALGPW